MIQHNGLWWPDADRRARPVLTAGVNEALRVVLSYVRGRDVAVQAGANVGVWPLALAGHFQCVFTCEPDAENAECLRKNLAARDSLGRVYAAQAAYGETPGAGQMVIVEPDNCGAHRVELVGEGDFAVITIDSLLLPACDLIWLDIEGLELPALKGASDTIERCNPVIALEDKGHHRTYGIADGALQAWLAERGYSEVDRTGNDKIFTRKSP